MAKKSPTIPRACIFCGRTPVSKEHIWSEWTYEYVPKKNSHHRRSLFRGAAGVMGLSHSKRYQGDMNTRKVRVVCGQHCNNGWMSGSETSVKPILIPLMLDKVTSLTPSDQRALAAWLVMKSMVCEFADPPEEPVSTAAERTYLMENLEPPPSYRVWIARQHATYLRTGFLRVAMTLGSAPKGQTPIPPDGTFAKNTQAITIGFGRLVVHIISTRVPGMDTIGPADVPLIWAPIWPVGERIVWPAGRIISDDGIKSIARALDAYTSKFPWKPSE